MHFRLGLLLIILLSLIPFASAQTNDEKPGTATLSGRVTEGDKPVPGILVTIRKLANGTSESYTAKTDEEGNYKITGIKAGRFMVVPNALAHVRLDADKKPTPTSPMITIDDAAEEKLDIQMKIGGVITGKIIDADGRPLISQIVVIFKKNENAKPVRFFTNMSNYRMYSTDDRGIYRIYGLPPAKYLIAVGEDGRTFQSSSSSNKHYPLTYYPGVQTEEKADEVEVTEGSEATNIDFTVGKEKKLYEAKGKIIDATTGQPLVGVRYSYGPLIKMGTQNRLGVWTTTDNRTDANGEFTIHRLASATYALWMQQEPGSIYYAEQTVFEVNESNVTGLEVKAQPGATISGIVVFDGEPTATVLAQLRIISVSSVTESNPSSPTPPVPDDLASRINADGTFRLQGVRAGKNRLHISAINASTDLLLLRCEKDGVELPRSFEVTNKSQLTGIRMIVGMGTGIIRGQVKIVGGTLPANAVLSVNARQTNVAASNGRNNWAQVDERGRFVMEKIFAGEYEITLNPPMIRGQQSPPKARMKWVTQNVTVGKTGESSVVLTLDLSEEGDKQ